MARKYTFEDLVFDVEAMLKAKLNDEIQLVIADRNDNIELPKIDPDAFFVQSMDDRVANYPDYVFIELIDIQSNGLGPMTSKDFQILVMICASTFNNTQQVRMMFRYLQALEQVFHKYWSSSTSLPIKLKIQSLPPQDYLNLNTTKAFKTAAVIINGGWA